MFPRIGAVYKRADLQAFESIKAQSLIYAQYTGINSASVAFWVA